MNLAGNNVENIPLLLSLNGWEMLENEGTESLQYAVHCRTAGTQLTNVALKARKHRLPFLLPACVLLSSPHTRTPITASVSALD